MSTSQKLIKLLNQKDRTVSELASELGISRNSAHVQVSKLEAAGTIEKYRPDRQVGAGKPAFYYRVIAEKEDAFSTAYKPILSGLIQAIGLDASAEERLDLLEKKNLLTNNDAEKRYAWH